jgi:hypothetical protein
MPNEVEAYLWTERVAKVLECEIGQVTINGPAEYSCAQAGSNYHYEVDIRSEGADGCRFLLEGGGV